MRKESEIDEIMIIKYNISYVELRQILDEVKR